ncbi:MAG: RDD family protein [Bdellovibrionales bacterium]|nr:RDD family protein [Bdellovibrionales bacterium]
MSCFSDQELGCRSLIETHRASPLDRIAAGVTDSLLILSPLSLLMIAPLKRNMTQAILFEIPSSLTQALLFSLLILLSIIFIYYIFFIYIWGATPGMKLFNLRVVDLWTLKPPKFFSACTRAFVQIFECFLFGLPWIALFSNPERRTLHDLISDTLVLSQRPNNISSPNRNESSLVRGLYLAIISITGILFFSLVGDTLGFMVMNDRSFIFSDAKKNTLLCEDISEIAKDKNLKNQSERLLLAMEIFAAGQLEQKCLLKEAEALFIEDPKINSQTAALGYLAKAFALSEEPDSSNEYLKKVCETDENSESCQMAEIIEHWSNEEWTEVEKIFSQIKWPLSRYTLVWKVRLHMKRAQFEEALVAMSSLSGVGELAHFLIPERVRALWRSSQIESAQWVAQSAYEMLNQETKTQLAGWMCYDELTHTCGHKKLSPSCQQLEQIVRSEDSSGFENEPYNLEDPYAILALSKINESCDQMASPQYYLGLKKNVHSKIYNHYYEALAEGSQGNLQNAKRKLLKILKDENTTEIFKADILLRLMQMSSTPFEVQKFLAEWRQQKTIYQLSTAPAVVQVLQNRNLIDNSIDLIQELIKYNKKDLFLSRDLVVSYYLKGWKSKAWVYLIKISSHLDYLQAGEVYDRTPAQTQKTNQKNNFHKIVKSLQKEFGDL